jgi:hypothetical protein
LADFRHSLGLLTREKRNLMRKKRRDSGASCPQTRGNPPFARKGCATNRNKAQQKRRSRGIPAAL